MSVKMRVICGILISALAFGTIWLMVFLVQNGIILLNNPSAEDYPIRGVDVSHYQGEIDWDKLCESDVSFAFIKATEGSNYIDPKFEYNWSEAAETDLRVGAYHFFSFDSDGKAQAENFIANVPVTEDMLPPVIDIEFYGDKADNPPKKKEVKAQLDVLVEALYEHYGTMPIIYATHQSYNLYIADDYKDCPIWIRDVIMTPYLSDNRDWTFWQYTNRERLEGYKGEEEFIDMNVFCGTAEEFENLLISKKD